MPPEVNENVDETAGEEIQDTAQGWQPKEDWDAAAEVTVPVKVASELDLTALATADAAIRLNNVLTGMTAPQPTVLASIEPIAPAMHVIAGSFDEPTDAEIAAAEAILARRKQPAPRDLDATVSDKPDPIRLIEDIPPVREAVTRIMIGDMEVIGTPDKIEYLRRLNGVIQDPEKAVVAAAQPVNPMITAAITAEQQAGRNALARRQAQAVAHPPLPKTEHELALEKPPVTIFRGNGADLQQHLLRQPAPPTNKGAGY